MSEALEITGEDLQDRHNALVARQHEHRMSLVPEVYKHPHERLACELALGMEEPDAVFLRYGFDADHALKLVANPGFAALVNRVHQEVQTSGLSFRTKAKAQAEELLAHSYEMATDPEASPAVRADLIKWTVKVAGLEPKEVKDDGKTGGGLNLTIQFSGQAPTTIVSRETQHEPLTLEG